MAELRRTPRAPGWRRQAAVVSTGIIAFGVVATLGAWLAGITSAERLVARGPVILLAFGLGALDAWGGLAPGRRRLVQLALGASLAGMAVLVAARSPGPPSAVPGWVCSASHLGLDLGPAVIALWGLRQSAWSWSRALTAGLGAGTAGAVLGELACQKGPGHVLIHHVGAWAAIAVACVLVSRALRPRSYAP